MPGSNSVPAGGFFWRVQTILSILLSSSTGGMGRRIDARGRVRVAWILRD